LENISIEPEVMQVIEALRLMGVDINVYKDTCTIKGRMKKNGFMISIIPDRIEAGTYALMGAVLAKEIRIHNVEINHLLYLLDLFDRMNVKYEINRKTLIIYKSNNIKGVMVNTGPYPEFPTDLQQPLTVLLTKANNDSVIKETIYKDRTAHIIELNKMGADITIKEDEYFIRGNKTLVGSELSGKDLRGGASLVFAALLAKGTSKIEGLKYIERGYFNIVDNLKSLGANIDVYED
jgi:UDP-N-acetylglucosamine 1-carboxyvinyltransferase